MESNMLTINHEIDCFTQMQLTWADTCTTDYAAMPNEVCYEFHLTISRYIIISAHSTDTK